MREWVAIALVALCACDRNDDDAADAAPRAVSPPPAPPRRVATQDQGLRVMVAEVAAAKACEMIRGQFRGLRAKDDPDRVIGVVWLRECLITNDGSDLTFHLGGNGWTWVAVVKKKAGATFDLHKYVRYAMKMTISGAIDVSYSAKTHVVSFWFTPRGAPRTEFEPVGEVDMDEEGAWSAVVGAMAAVFSKSIDERAAEESKKSGKKEFRKSFADGMAVTMDLCSGMTRFGLERPATGKMVAPDVGETRDVTVELQPGGLMVFGPFEAPHGIHVQVHPRAGAVRTEIVCQAEGERIAQEFVSSGSAPPTRRPLASDLVYGQRTLRAPKASCKVVVVARPVPGQKQPAVFDWKRPTTEAARSMGGSIVPCK